MTTATTELKVAVRQSFLPTVLVLCPKQLDDLSVARTAQSFAHFLQHHNTLEVLSREAAGPGLKVRFADAAAIAGVPDSALGDHLQRATAAASAQLPDYGAYAIRTQDDVMPFLRAFADPTPWFREWRDAYVRGIPAAPHSGVSHPVACVVAVPGGPPLDVSAAGAVAALWAGAEPPPLFQAMRFLDPTIPRFYAVLQTGADQEAARAAEQRLAELHGIYGAKNCCMLRLNALTGMAGTATRRTRLDAADVQELERFVRTVIAAAVIPFLHSTINTLLQQQALARKGVGSRMRAFFFRSSSSSSAPATQITPPSTPPASSTSPLPEQQSSLSLPSYSPTSSSSSGAAWGNVSPTRRLADFQFLAGDYENAAKSY
jgi:hypothetical protein